MQTPTKPQRRLQESWDLKAWNVDQNTWEAAASEQSTWRQTVQKGLYNLEATIAQQFGAKRLTRKAQRLKGWQTDQHQAFHLCSVWKGLSLPYWPVQPHSTLYQSRNSIVSWDWQMPNICIQSWPFSFVDTSLYSHIVDNLKIANNLSVKTSCCMSPPPAPP